MAPPRILLCGDVLGRLNQLFKRVSSVNKSSGPFDALFCVGQFFPDTPDLLEEFMVYVEGSSQIPLPTYFIGDYGIGAPKVLLPVSRDPANQGFKMDGFKICHNLYWLKGSGKFTLHGLSVAYLSGRRSSSDQKFGTYTQDDVDALRAIAEEPGLVDLFLTNEWPRGVTNSSAVDSSSQGISDSSGDCTITELVMEIKPRYHFAGTAGVFYAREPYSNLESSHITRFVGLAPVGNKDKQKFIHAISPTPASIMSPAEISTKPPNTTVCPYTNAEQQPNTKEAAKRNIDCNSDSQYWRYDVSQKRQKHGAEEGDKLCFKFVFTGSCPREEKCHFQHDTDAREQFMRGVCLDFIIKGKCDKGAECKYKHSLQEGEGFSHSRTGNSELHRSKECWFCMTSPNLESHLIISVGEQYYIALAKGPLVEDHVLIIPVEHFPNTLLLSEECENELVIFQDSLKMYYKNQGKEVVFFEWISKQSTHANLQAVPVPSSRASSIKNIFLLAAKKLGFELMTIKNNSTSQGRKMLKELFKKDQSLIYVELPDGTILSHTVGDNKNFPAQFGREVLAGLLNIADRADWRKCTLSKEDEIKMAESFKSRFEVYDPIR